MNRVVAIGVALALGYLAVCVVLFQHFKSARELAGIPSASLAATNTNAMTHEQLSSFESLVADSVNNQVSHTVDPKAFEQSAVAYGIVLIASYGAFLALYFARRR